MTRPPKPVTSPHSTYKFTLTFSLLAVLGAACSPEVTPPAGTGGAVGTGGVLGSGGTVGSGGAIGSGGATASGGAIGSGGATASGGQASGGALGSGGATASGGATSSGGQTATGGDTGSGGGSTASAGCGKGTAAPDDHVQQTIQVGNLTRYYLLHVPDNADPNEPLPLIFAIHGLNMNNVWAAHDDSGFQLIEATAGEAILVYPQGIQNNGQSNPPSSQSQWGDADSCWGGGPPNANVDKMNADLAYFDAMLETVSDDYCIDTGRIFAMGFSQGGFMSNTLGCERASVYRGLGTFAGWGPWGSGPNCADASAKQAVIQTQGDTDGTVTPQLGQTTRDFWLDRANCTNTTMPSAFGAGCVDYQGCDADSPNTYCTHGGDHFVPGGTGARAWEFFQSLD